MSLSFDGRGSGGRWIHYAAAPLTAGGMLVVESYSRTRLVGLYWKRSNTFAGISFTEDEARAIAAELLACADAIKAEQAGTAGAVGGAA